MVVVDVDMVHITSMVITLLDVVTWVDPNLHHTTRETMHTITNLIALGVLEAMVLVKVTEVLEDVKV
jgi:hypothetical protein